MLEFLVAYFWNIMALFIAPILGFIVGQFWKMTQPERPNAWRIAGVNGIVTAAISTWFWPGVLDEALKIALTTGIGGPIIILVWFWIASKYAPKAAEQLRGQNGSLTIIPWALKVKNPEKLKKPIDFDVTGGKGSGKPVEKTQPYTVGDEHD